MIKTVKVDSKTTIKLSNNIGWMLAYRDQFGRDIVPVLTPVLAAVLDVAGEVNKVAQGQNVAPATLMQSMDTDTLRDAIFEMSGLEFVDFINIVWAMAKAADEDIDEPREWVKQFDTFPLDVLGPVVFDMVLSCMVSTKNLKRLRTAMQSLKPSVSTGSSSQDETQD